MTYLAPRQGLFAIIIAVCFCLQTTLMVISSKHQANKMQEQTSERILTQVVQDARLPLASGDRVSLSVLANRYANEPDIARLLIKDSTGNIIVPIGNAPLQQGDSKEKPITQDNTIVGNVELTLKAPSAGEIIANQWGFVIGSLVINIFIFLLYGYLARPTKDQLEILSRDIKAYVQESLANRNQRQTKIIDKNEPDSELEKKPQGNISDFLKSQHNLQETEQEPVHINNTPQQSDTPEQKQDNQHTATHNPTVAKQDNPHVPEVDNKPKKANTNNSSLAPLPNRKFKSIDLQIVFDDPNNFLNTLNTDISKPYFNLCNEILNKAATELLKLPEYRGITIAKQTTFTQNGAIITLQTNSEHSKIALASMTLGKLYIMLNDVVYSQHRQIAKFALLVKIAISDQEMTKPTTQLLNKRAKQNDILLQLPHLALQQIAERYQLNQIKLPKNVYEREALLFGGCSEVAMKQLEELRKTILQINETED